jgi:hypothetical protein
MRWLSLAKPPVQNPRSAIFDKSHSEAILAKSNGKAGQSQPNVAPCRDNLTNKRWHDLILQPYQRSAGGAGTSKSYLYSQLVESIFVNNNNNIDKEVSSFSQFFYHLHIFKGLFIFLIAEIEITKSVHSL